MPPVGSLRYNGDSAENMDLCSSNLLHEFHFALFVKCR